MTPRVTVKATVALMHQQHGDLLLKRLCLHGVPREEAKDIQQDYYVSLLTGSRKCPKKLTSHFVVTVARALSCNYFRDKDRMPEFVAEIQMTERINNSYTLPVLEQHALEQWQRDALIAAKMVEVEEALEISKSYLCDGEYPIHKLLLAKADGFTDSEIAEFFQVERSTISRWFSAWHKYIATERRINNGKLYSRME